MRTAETTGQSWCSRAGCGGPADWEIVWRNPRIHGEERFKTWLACAEHVGFLRDYLASRDFPITVTAVNSTDSTAPSVGDRAP